MTTLKLGTRKSNLALWQANYVKDQILQKYPHQKVKIIPYQTSGDKIKNTPLYEIGGKGLFTKELEEALIQKKIDFAVQSIKDIPGIIDDCFTIPIVFERENALDSFITTKYKSLKKLPINSVVGTSSPRRAAQLLSYRSDLSIFPLRGNVETRINALKEGKVSAIILAVAGLKRLGLEKYITEILPLDISIPAIGQGIIGLECLKENRNLINYFQDLNHRKTYLCLLAERSFLKELNGNCYSPIAAYATIFNEKLMLQAFASDIEGKKVLKSKILGDTKDALQLGKKLATDFIKKGINNILP